MSTDVPEQDAGEAEIARGISEALKNGSPLVGQIFEGLAKIKDAQLAYNRDALPLFSEVTRRRDWQLFSLRVVFLVGALAAVTFLLFLGRIAEALQVFSLIAGYFLGFADRGQTSNHAPQQSAPRPNS